MYNMMSEKRLSPAKEKLKQTNFTKLWAGNENIWLEDDSANITVFTHNLG